MPMKKEHMELCKDDDWMKQYGKRPRWAREMYGELE